jgi:hypothetical protein
MLKHLRFVAVLLFGACQLQAQQPEFRGYRKAELPAGWQWEKGTLTRVGDGGDIITKDTYENFQLTLEWKISEGGNSGIFFHVVEDSAHGYVFETGPEMQVLDNTKHPDGKNPKTSAGSNFDVHAPVRDVTKPVGEWNKAKLIVKGPHVEHWLNGVKLLEYELWSDQWKQDVANSKFKSYKDYGLAHSGHIALQDHGNWVAFRNIKIKRLD